MCFFPHPQETSLPSGDRGRATPILSICRTSYIFTKACTVLFMYQMPIYIIYGPQNSLKTVSTRYLYLKGYRRCVEELKFLKLSGDVNTPFQLPQAAEAMLFVVKTTTLCSAFNLDGSELFFPRGDYCCCTSSSKQWGLSPKCECSCVPLITASPCPGTKWQVQCWRSPPRGHQQRVTRNPCWSHVLMESLVCKSIGVSFPHRIGINPLGKNFHLQMIENEEKDFCSRVVDLWPDVVDSDLWFRLYADYLQHNLAFQNYFVCLNIYCFEV